MQRLLTSSQVEIVLTRVVLTLVVLTLSQVNTTGIY